MQKEVLDKMIKKVWAIEPFQLFRELVDNDLWEGGTIAAEDMFNDEFLFKPRAALVAHLYQKETGDVLA